METRTDYAKAKDFAGFNDLVRNYPSFSMQANVSYIVKYHDEPEIKIKDDYMLEKSWSGEYRFSKIRNWEKRNKGSGQNRNECIYTGKNFYVRGTHGDFILWDDAVSADFENCEKTLYNDVRMIFGLFRRFGHDEARKENEKISVISFTSGFGKSETGFSEGTGEEFGSFFRSHFIPVSVSGKIIKETETDVPVNAELTGRFKLLKGQMEADFELTVSYKLSRIESVAVAPPENFISSKRDRTAKMVEDLLEGFIEKK
jgi:hypothetical protein